MESLELGVHFYPSDVELLLLLKKKVEGKRHPSSFVIERDLYDSESPWELFRDSDPWEREIYDYEKKEKKLLHVFTKLCYLSEKRIKRTSGCGTWNGENKGKPITNDKGETIGLKKSFTFVSKSCPVSEMQGHWIMYEYSLSMTKTDYVICKIIRTRPKSSHEEELDVASFVDSHPCKKLKCDDSNTTSTVSAALSSSEFSARSFEAMPRIINLPDGVRADEFHQLSINLPGGVKTEVLESFQHYSHEFHQLRTLQPQDQELQNSFVDSCTAEVSARNSEAMQPMIDMPNGVKTEDLESFHDYDQSEFQHLITTQELQNSCQDSDIVKMLESFQDYDQNEFHQLSTTQELQNSCVDSKQGNNQLTTTPASTLVDLEQEEQDLQNHVLDHKPSTPKWMQKMIKGLEFSESLLYDFDDSTV